ncbi:adenosylcobinamide-phosphate synthase [Phyllobacterium phragmitis]|uniref:Cobalamin biosynthesis protein CobD n=1 Tax=Phyllobacterium phragmitis TaxID=2670329 RepID=A0A2S9IX33_9HYPH|nr:adenosylcobinamide-phosphate synthase CbiB [Phyllobacterium phragmitis]PRD45079.1 adenosylcobinamide-phosphate synthase [Phyllobacterium phragmitis]
MEIKLLVLFLALVADRLLGDPERLWRVIPHPVVLFGKAISFIDDRYNDARRTSAERRRNGALAMAALLLTALIVGMLLSSLLRHMSWFGALIEITLVAVLLAQKSLADHVSHVATSLREEGLEGGRRAVSMIVGRDPQSLDPTGVSRAAIESLAENSSDGVVAPVFWYLLLGLPGLLAYKLLNTADSMIGHLNPRYRDFGRFAARLDDAANWIPARLTGCLTVLAAWLQRGRAAAMRSFGVMMRDARLHRSPNAGWPETAYAGALDVALAGPRVYAGDIVNEPMINGAGKCNLGAGDIEAALRLFWFSMTILTALVLVFCLIGLLF